MTVDENGEFTEDFKEVLRWGVHRLYCVPYVNVGNKGRHDFVEDLASPRGDKTGEYPCLCSNLTITYNGKKLRPGE